MALKALYTASHSAAHIQTAMASELPGGRTFDQVNICQGNNHQADLTLNRREMSHSLVLTYKKTFHETENDATTQESEEAL